MRYLSRSSGKRSINHNKIKNMSEVIVKIDPQEYGLEESKAKQISDMFKPMLDKMVELEREYNKVVNLDITPETCKKAKELRLQYVKVRTGTAKIHKDLKRFYLQGGRFVDGWKNAQLMASQGIEERLAAIENYYENIERERIAKLHHERAAVLEQYEVEVIPDNLGKMEEEVWNNYLTGTKANYEARKQAERKAEEDRKERERLAALHAERRDAFIPVWDFLPDEAKNSNLGLWEQKKFVQVLKKAEKDKAAHIKEQQRIREEKEKLRKEAEERERQAKIEAEKRAKEERERQAKAEAERKKREEKERKEREEYEAKLKAEREERTRIQRELEAKAEAEEKAKKEEADRRQAELSKGDADKVNDLIAELTNIKDKYTFKSERNKNMFLAVCVLIDKVIAYIQK